MNFKDIHIQYKWKVVLFDRGVCVIPLKLWYSIDSFGRSQYGDYLLRIKEWRKVNNIKLVN